MITTITALKNLYVACGGTASDVANITTIAEMIEALKNVLQGGGGSDLPAVTSDDNGKVLTVVEGDWDKANAAGGKTLYNHVIRLSYEDDNVGPLDAYINIISSSSTALTYASLKTWVDTNGAIVGNSKSYPASNFSASGTFGNTVKILSNKFYLTFGIIDSEIPNDATISDTVTEI